MATPSSLRSRQQRAGNNDYTPSKPVTPRYSNAHVYANPFATPSQPTTPISSLSASVPFDWDAAKNGRPAPYGNLKVSPLPGSTLKPRGRQSVGGSGTNLGVERQRVVRQAGWFERLLDLPSRILFDIQMLPENIPFPSAKKLGLCIGLFCHLIHIIVTYASAPTIVADDYGDGWSDMKNEIKSSFRNGQDEMDGEPGWYWSTLFKWLLICYSFGNAFYLFTRVKAYTLQHQTELVNSPNARFVLRDPDLESISDSPLWRRFLRGLGTGMVVMWRFLIGSPSSVDKEVDAQLMVQRLDTWLPSDTEMIVLTVYSPVHALLYPILGWSQVVYSILVSAGMSSLLYLLTTWFEMLVKDRAIIGGQVMREYDMLFVQPRLNVVRKDACVMTNEAEMVDFHQYQPGTSRRLGRESNAHQEQHRSLPQLNGDQYYGDGSPRTAPAPRKSIGKPREILRF